MARALYRDDGKLRALGQGDLKPLVWAVIHSRSFFAGGAVGNHAIPAAHVVNDDVVDHAAALVEHAAVKGFADFLQLGDVVGQ